MATKELMKSLLAIVVDIEKEVGIDTPLSEKENTNYTFFSST
jgi:hypothetical protein